MDPQAAAEQQPTPAHMSLAVASRSTSSSGGALGPSGPSLPPDLAALLLDMPYFRGAPNLAEFVAAIGTDVKLRACDAGEVLITHGERAKSMFFLLRGCVQVSSKDGEVVFAELGPGNYCGWRVSFP